MAVYKDALPQTNWKRTLLAALAFSIILTLPYPSFGDIRLPIMLSQDSDIHRSVLESFTKELDGSKQIVTVKYDLDGQFEKGLKIARKIRTFNPDMVLAIGTIAALAAKKEIKDVPIVFCLVLNPVSSGLVESMESPDGNITGASLDIPLITQYKYAKLLIPDLKNIGVIYNPEETGKLVQNAAEVAKQEDLLLTARAIYSEREVSEALWDLVNKIDALWSVADGTVFGPQSTQYILLNTLRTGTPFIGLSPSFVKAGALMALSCDYYDIGKQAAGIANRILNGESPEDIPISVPRKVSFHINLKTADHIGLQVSQDVIKLADEVIR